MLISAFEFVLIMFTHNKDIIYSNILFLFLAYCEPFQEVEGVKKSKTVL